MAISVYLRVSGNIHQMIRRTMILFAGILSTACMAAANDWHAYIRLVEQADGKTLQALPQEINRIGDTLDDRQTEALTTALSRALIKDPIAVITATRALDHNADPLKQRFGSSFICAIPGMTHFTQQQIEAYFARAEPALKRAGPEAAGCLGTLQEVIEEVRQEIAQHPAR